MQNNENHASNITTLRKPRSIYSVFQNAEKVVVGVDCISDGKVAVPKSKAALEAILAVTDAAVEESDNAALGRIYDGSNSVVIQGEPKVFKETAYVFQIDGKYYVCDQKYLNAFSKNGNIIKAGTSDRKAWSVHDSEGDLVAVFMPINSSVVTDDMFDSLPLVSEVLENEKSGQETPTKELKNETKNDKIEENKNYKEGIAYTNDNAEIQFRYKLVDIEDLVVSNDIDGRVNPDYPAELQPRDRERSASVSQVMDIAKNLNPARMAESNSVSDGAPIVGPDNVVESGNGRTMALAMVYDRFAEKAEEYKQYLVEHAAEYGIDAETMPERPILVRERITDVDRAEFARVANESYVAAHNSTDQARIDAERITDQAFELLKYSADGDINLFSKDNKPFIEEMIANVFGKSDLNNLVTAEGMLSANGVSRVENALFYKAYGDTTLTALLSERTDNPMKNIVKAMLNVSPRVAVLSNGIKQGVYYDFDFSGDIVSAAKLLYNLKQEGTKLDAYIAQQSLVEQESEDARSIAICLDADKRSAKKCTDFFNEIMREVQELGNPDQISLFGNKVQATKGDILNGIIRRRNNDVVKKEYGTSQTIRNRDEVGRNDDTVQQRDGQDKEGSNDSGVETAEQSSEGRTSEEGKINYSFDTEEAVTETGGKISYSLEGEKWRPDLSKKKLIALQQIIKRDVATSTKIITDTANWLFTNLDGTKVFAIYSTENTTNPTLLYESKGKRAEIERDILVNMLEAKEHGESADGKSDYVNWVSGGGWLRHGGGVQNSVATVGRGRGDRNAGVLPGQSKRKPSRAFESVVRNLFEIQGANRSDSGRVERGNLDHSNYALESGEEYGERNILFDGSEQRNVSERSGKQARGLDQSARRGSEKTIQAREKFIRGLTNNQKETQILIDSEGRRHKFTVVKQSAWNEHMKNLAAYYAAQGLRVEFLAGSIIVEGVKRPARGMRNGDVIYVSYNNRKYSPEQIAEHEYIHNKFETDEVQEAKEQILARMPEDEYRNAIEKISEAYAGVAKQSEMEEELICNILSGMYENAAEYADIVNRYWNKVESNMSGYDVSQYAESIDAGGNRNALHTIEIHNDDLLERAHDLGFEFVIKKTKAKTFRPYNESKSDTNERATRWAHNDKIAVGAQKAISHRGRWYVIEKFDSSDLGYQIVGTISVTDIKKFMREVKKRESEFKQTKQRVLAGLAGGIKNGNKVELRGYDVDSDTNQHGREVGTIQKVDSIQNGRQPLSNDAGRSAEQDSTDRKSRSTVESLDVGGEEKSRAADLNLDGFEQVLTNEILRGVAVAKVKMRQFPSRKESGGSDTNQYCTLWSYREDVSTGDQTIVFHNGRCYVIEKYDNIEFKYQIVGKIRYADYQAVREEILADVRNNNESTIKEMVGIYNKRNRQGNRTEGRGQSTDGDSVGYGREDRQILQMDTNQDGGREIRINSTGSDAHNSADRQSDSAVESLDVGGEVNGETNSNERGIREISEGNRYQRRRNRSLASDISVGNSMVENNEGGHQTNSRRNGTGKSDSKRMVADAQSVVGSQVEGREETDGRRYLEAVKSGDEKTARQLLDAKAKENGYIPVKVYHGSNFDDIKMAIIKENGTVWVTSDFDYADKYSDGYYGNDVRAEQVFTDKNSGVYELYAKIRNPIDLGNIERELLTFNEIVDFGKKYGLNKNEILRCREEGLAAFESKEIWAMTITKSFADAMRKQGYDAMSAIEGDGIQTYGILYPENVKSAKTVTYDDEGNIVPLEKRFDSSTNKINYSFADDGEYDFFDMWNEALEKYGPIPKGENPAREISVPKKISEDQPISYFARTMLEANVTPDEALSEFEQAILDGNMSHEVITDKKALNKARSDIETHGFQVALRDWEGMTRRGVVGKEQLVLGMELYNQCVNNKDYKNAMKIAAELAAEATRAGQTLQACRVLKLMSPDGQLYYLEKSIEKMNKEFKQKLGKKFQDIKLDEELMEEFYKADSEESRDVAYDKICQHIADQIPSTMLDKWDSWRYLAMLGNPRTHIRNIVGNALFTPAIRIKNYISAVGESIAKVETAERTKSVRKTKEAVAFAKKDFEEMVDVLQGVNAKYAVTSDIEGKRRIFKTEWLEKVRNKNFEFLEKEDMWFLKAHYVDALARIITARKLDVDHIDIKTLDVIRAYAVKEAQAATYRDANVLAEGLNKLQRKIERSNKKLVRASSALVEGVMPFKKTPFNIAKQGVLYSPVSIMTGTYQLLKGVKEETHTTAEAIDTLSKGLTGTGLMLLGFFLASIGALSGPEDDKEKKQEFDEMVGEQPYALNIGGVSYTVDWAAPLNLSLFTGAVLHETTKDGQLSFAKIVDALVTLPEPLLELSVFSGISDIIGSAKYSTSDEVVAMGTNVVTNYLTQAFPTIGGQISRLIDPTRRDYYYTDKNSELPKGIQNLIGKASSKIPFASYLFAPSVDEWGREETYGGTGERAVENFVSPGYYSQENYTQVDKEIQALYERTGKTTVLPRVQEDYYTEDGVQYNMTAEQYAEAKKIRGQKSFEFVQKLIRSSSYKKMNDQEKIKAITKCYDKAGDYAKEKMIKKVKRNKR